MVEINHEKCIGCLQCIEICPFTILYRDKDGKPRINREKHCLQCMHCACICPADAITLDGKAGYLDRPWAPLPPDTLEKFEQLLLQRRSCRHFQKKPVPRELVKRAIELSGGCPSAKNQHPTRWLVIEDAELIRQACEMIVEKTRAEGKSPELVEEWDLGNNAVTGRNSAMLVGYCADTAINPTADSTIAVAMIELMLQAQGVGTCWAGYFTRIGNTTPGFRELLGIPEGHSLFASFMYGWPDEEHYIRIPRRPEEQQIIWK